MKRLPTKAEALSKITLYCARAERCIADVDKRLNAWMILPADRSDIIKTLLLHAFVDEQRYANAFARDKSKFQGWGVRKIEYALKAKGIKESLIQRALQEVDREALQTQLFILLNKKKILLLLKYDMLTVKHKLLQFALSRGFSYEDAKTMINKVV